MNFRGLMRYLVAQHYYEGVLLKACNSLSVDISQSGTSNLLFSLAIELRASL